MPLKCVPNIQEGNECGGMEYRRGSCSRDSGGTVPCGDRVGGKNVKVALSSKFLFS